MNPQLSAYVSIFFVIIGMVAAWIMLEVHGRPGQRDTPRARKTFHKIFGYLFVLVYLTMCGWMVKRAGACLHALSSRVVMHIGLSLFMAPALAFKLLIVRRYNRFFNYLPVLGTSILAMAFTLSALTAGYYFLHRSHLNAGIGWETKESHLNEALAWGLVDQKCGKCHSLERVLKANKDRPGWILTVIRMADKDAPHIRPFQARQIVWFLSASPDQKRSTADPALKAGAGEELVKTKCSGCHDLQRVYKMKKDMEWWHKTIDRMIENAEDIGEPEFLTEPETEAIIKFLVNRN